MTAVALAFVASVFLTLVLVELSLRLKNLTPQRRFELQAKIQAYLNSQNHESVVKEAATVLPVTLGPGVEPESPNLAYPMTSLKPDAKHRAVPVPAGR